MATGEALYTDASGDVYYDLTTKTGDRATIDGAKFFTQAATGSSGTGLIQAFVRTQATGDEAGYNTSERPLFYDENSSPQFTKSLLLNQVPVVTIDGVDYYEFRLDINQTNNNPLLSLNELKIYKSTTGTYHDAIDDPDFTGPTTLVWDLDDQNLDGTDDTDNTVLLDYSLQAGSGKSDMFFYVKVSDFGGANPDTTYVVLYSEFGNTGTLDAADGGNINSTLYGDYSSNDGFEEWSVSKALEGPIISGYKFHDVNGNGLWDDGEEGLGGWKIDYTLTYKDGNGINAPTVTINLSAITSDGTTDYDGNGELDPVGFYVISVPLGAANNTMYTLTLTENLTAGWSNTFDGDVLANKTTTFTFSENDLTNSPGDISGEFGLAERMNFGNFELFDISGTKYTDDNGDGATTGDVGLGGVTIFIDFNGNTLNDDGAANQTLTAADGTWSFTGLDYTYAGKMVFEVLPSGYTQTLGALGYEITGTSGTDQTGLDFANFELFDISGTKYTDDNGDGLTDGDAGLANVTIFIDLDDSGTLTLGDATTLTDSDGNWSFTDLDYTYAGKFVFEVLPSGYVQTLGALGYEITGTSGADQTGLDFANFELFDISGTKYTDDNGDGLTDGDVGLANVTIFIDLDDSGTLTLGDETTLTDSDGNWSFTDLDKSYAGKFVFEVLPSGYVQTLGELGYEITGTSGADQTGLDFANFELFDISGTKYTDANGDGLTAGDDGLANVVIFIDLDESGDLSLGDETTLTDSDGNWSFTDLDKTYAGKFVFEVLPSGYVQTLGELGYEITGTSGADQTGLDFANFQLFSVSGTKYLDLTGDGITGDDTPLGGITIFIDANHNDSFDLGEKFAITAADGTWSIGGLDQSFVGAEVEELLDGSFIQTVGQLGSILGTEYLIVGTSGNNQTGIDFANSNFFSISGTKFTDENGDGATTGDVGLGGVTIFIDFNGNTLNDDGVLNQTVTAADGTWSFNHLNATYVGKFVFELLPSGYTQTLGELGYEITGTDQTGLDFANFELFDISGTKYLDANGDGQTTGDSGLGGVTIFIDVNEDGNYDAGIDEATLTAADGSWSFNDLDQSFAGLFVYEVVPGGYVQTLGQAGYEIIGTSGDDQAGLDFANTRPDFTRTPGFWSNHLSLWDGIVGNGPKQSGNPNDDFPDDELLYQVDSNGDGIKDSVKGLLIGDYNRNGLTDSDEDTFFISLTDAKSLINANEKKMDDGVVKIGRDAVATWLNYLAFDTVSNPISDNAKHYLNDAVDWLQLFGDSDASNTNVPGETFDDYDPNHVKVKTSTDFWNQDGGSYPADHSGDEIHSSLDYYNNNGVVSII